VAGATSGVPSGGTIDLLFGLAGTGGTTGNPAVGGGVVSTGVAGKLGGGGMVGVVGKAGNGAGVAETGMIKGPSGGGTMAGSGKSGTAGIGTSAAESCGSGKMAAGVSARAGK
jgi:hypothetical protein